MSRGRNAAMRWRGRLGVFALVLAAFALPNRIAAQEMEVPTSVQIPLFLKVITFDRQLHSRGHGDFVIAVAYQSGNRTSTTVRDEVVRAFEAAHETVAGAPVRVVTIDLDKESAADALKGLPASIP